jgi:linoleate 8R-lipoxygenase/9,12-octadecadienoate 8-hydroperoxide 8R-isomerase
MSQSKRFSFRKDIQKSFGQLQQVFHASSRPLPTQTGDGSYVKTPPKPTGLASDLPHVNLKEVEALVEIAKDAATGDPQNDKDYIMERVIEVRQGLLQEIDQTSHFELVGRCPTGHIPQWKGSDRCLFEAAME